MNKWKDKLTKPLLDEMLCKIYDNKYEPTYLQKGSAVCYFSLKNKNYFGIKLKDRSAYTLASIKVFPFSSVCGRAERDALRKDSDPYQ